jgi:hypothetical protein
VKEQREQRTSSNMVSAKTLAYGYQPSGVKRGGKAKTYLGDQPKKHCRAASGLPTTKHKPTHKKPTPPATKNRHNNPSFFCRFFLECEY